MIWVVLMIFISTTITFSQECRISLVGFILDRATHEPMEFANIGIQETAAGAITDSAGYFVIQNICPGEYHIGVEHLGCDPVKVFITIQRDTSITIFIDHHGELLKEVTVSGIRTNEDETQTQNVISSTQLKNQVGQNLADITSQISGIHALRNGSGISKPIIHGMFGNRIAVINNGLSQAGQQWGSDHAPEIDPNSAGIIRVIKGSDAIEYGSQAMGGAVLVDAGPIQNDPHLHGFSGYAFETNGRGHTVFAKISKSIPHLDWRLSGTLRKQGDHRTPDYFLTNTGSNESNASAQFSYHPREEIRHELYYSLFHTNIGIFAGSHISNLTDLASAIARQEPLLTSDRFSYNLFSPRQKVTHHLLRYSGKKFVGNSNTLEWTYGLQSNHRQEFDIRRGDRSDIPALDLQLWSHQGQLKWRSEKNAFTYQAGLQGGWTDNANDYDTGILPLIPDYTKGTGTVFVQTKFSIGKVEVESGARYDLHKMHVWAISQSLPRKIIERDHTYHDVAFALGSMIKQRDIGETRFHNVLVRRSPDVNELYSNGLHQGIAGIEEGDWNLTPETSFKSILTQSVHLEDILHAEVSVYSHWINDYIFLQPDDELRLTIRGAFPVYHYRQEDSWIRGFDASMSTDFSHRLEVRSGVSFIRGNRLDENISLTFIPPLKWTSAVAWSFKDSDIYKGTKLSIEGTYTGRQNHWDEESELLAPPEAYYLLLIKFETAFRTGSDLWHIGIIGNNLLNVRYRDYLNRLRYFTDEQGRSVRVTIRYEF